MLREFSAGGIVYKKEGEDILWLIRRPKGGKGYRGNLGWSFPKGWLDKGETLEQAALREVAEEGGVKAKIIKKLSALKIFFTSSDNQKVKKSITYFVMERLEDLKEGFGWETEEIRWVSKDEALELLTYKNEQKLLEQAAKTLTTT
jgi:8-oxo-dGTP pyrophosphatase MutT (NUDIX family)